MASSGKRFEIIVLEVKKNNESAVKELYQLQDYFDKHFSEKYVIVASDYGRVNKVFPKLFLILLEKGLVDNPLKLLYNVNKAFIDSKKLSGLFVGSAAWVAALETIFKGDKK